MAMIRRALTTVFILAISVSAWAAPLHRADQQHGTPDQLKLGQQVYAQCTSCHGLSGQGRLAFAPRLDSDDLLSVVGNDFLSRAVAEGRIGTQMPAFQDRLLPGEIDAVVA